MNNSYIFNVLSKGLALTSCAVYMALLSALPTLAQESGNAFKKAPKRIVNELAAGNSQDLIVVFDDRSAQKSAAELQSQMRLPSHNRLIIQQKAEKYAETKQKALSTLTSNESTELKSYRNIPTGFIRFHSRKALEKLLASSDVVGVYENTVMHKTLTESLPLIGQPQAEGGGDIGAGTSVAVLDTGVDYTNAAFGTCSSPGDPGCKVAYAGDFAPDDGQMDDDGHGTNVAGIVLGVAPGGQVLALDVFGLNGASDSDILAAIDWVITNQATYNIGAINMSLGDGLQYQSPVANGLYNTAVDQLRNAGILTIAAAGNDGYIDAISQPAATEGVISVGAVYDSLLPGSIEYSGVPCTDIDPNAEQVTCFSNSASFLTLLAPGAVIMAAGIPMSGTSQAAPHVAGAVAVLRAAYPAETLDQTVARLTNGVMVTDSRNDVILPRLDLLMALDTPNQNPVAEMPTSITVPSSDSDGSYIISWSASSSTPGVSYILEEATDSTFTTDNRTAYTGTSISASISGRVIGTTYYYRVKATASGYADSAWKTGANGCVVPLPTVIQPATITVPTSDSDGSYSVSWGASTTGGVSYILEEATNSSFTTGNRIAYTGTSTSVSISGRVTGTTYYYRVKSAKSGYSDSVWKTGAHGCVVSMPPAVQPATITVPASDPDGSYRVRWGASTTVGPSYTLEEATNSTFTTGNRVAYTGTSINVVISGRVTGTTYYYRVKATKSGYADSAWKTGANGCVVPLPTAIQPVTITVPASAPDGGSYSVSWGASTTAGVSYTLEEATNSSFTTGNRIAYSGTSTSVSISGRVTGTTYYYRVKATTSGYLDSVWRTGANGCVVPLPTATQPATITVPTSDPDGSYSVSWGASTTVGPSYTLEEATNSTFTTGNRIAYTGTSITASISGRVTATTYYYRVKAAKSGYSDSIWKTGANGCAVTLPTAIQPVTITVPASDPDGSYSVSWGASTTVGSGYTLEEATNSTFTTGYRVAYTGTSTTASISGRVTGTTYYYRVKAAKSGYSDSPWKTGANGCVVPLPTAIQPATITVPASAADGSYNVSWGVSTTAGSSYTLEEATSSTFTTGKRIAYTGTSTTASISGRVTGATYYYRVKATKPGYSDSAWKTGANGCFVPLPTATQPATITVPTSDSDGSYSVRWGASTTAGVSYTLEEATNSTFTTGNRIAYTGTSITASISGRVTATTYYYRVKAAKSGYSDSIWKTGANGCAVTLPTAIQPATITVPTSDPDGSYSVSWGASTTVGPSYTLEEATNSTFTVGNRVVYTGTSSTASISGRVAGTTYYYRVKAAKSGYSDSVWRTGANGCVVFMPTAIQPATITVPASDPDGRYIVRWGASTTVGASYTLEEATNSTFTAGNRVVYTGTSITASISRRVVGTNYYYRVKTTKSGYLASAWKTGDNGCIVPLPTVIQPANNSRIRK